MSWFWFIAQLLTLVALPLAHIALGFGVSGWISRRLNAKGAISTACAFLLGLSLHLLIAAVVSAVPLGPQLASFKLPFLTFIVLLAIPCAGTSSLKIDKFKIEFSKLLFLIPIVIIGTTLISRNGGIHTIWLSNYGDFAMHVGMISSFVFGENLPAEHFALPGYPLSYPIFVNLWASFLWWPNPRLETLPLIMCYQWTLLWLCVWAAFPRRAKLLTFAILFAGGSYDLIIKNLHEHPGAATDILGNALEIDRLPWHPFLSSIWIPQRTSLYGVAILSSSFFLFESWRRNWRGGQGMVFQPSLELIICGLLLSLSVLGHGHFVLVGMAYFSLLQAAFLIRTRLAGDSSLSYKNFLIFVFSLFPLIFSLPFVQDKGSMLSYGFGWMPLQLLEGDSAIAAVGNVALSWLHFGIFLIPYFLFSLVFLKARLELLLLLVLFLLFNFVKLSYWEWDQIKLFAPLTVIFVLLLAWRVQWPASSLRNVSAQLLLVPMILPGLFDFASTIKSRHLIEIFTANDIAIAREIVNMTEPCSIILAEPVHTSPVMLSGRRMYLGYPGWLWSQGFEFQNRAQVLDQPLADAVTSLANDRTLRDECPRFLLWTAREQAHWTNVEPESLGMPQVSPHLYRIR